MPLSPEEFYDQAAAAADEEQRLPLSRMTEWDLIPLAALLPAGFDPAW